MAKVMPISGRMSTLAELKRYKIVLIDESHNLRNREGERYRAIHEYIHTNDSRCILLSATPYNKNYVDLSNQLRLFVPDDKDIGVRPERKVKELTEVDSFAAISAQSVRSPRSKKAIMPMIGESSCVSTWCGAREPSFRITTPKQIQ